MNWGCKKWPKLKICSDAEVIGGATAAGRSDSAAPRWRNPMEGSARRIFTPARNTPYLRCQGRRFVGRKYGKPRSVPARDSAGSKKVGSIQKLKDAARTWTQNGNPVEF